MTVLCAHHEPFVGTWIGGDTLTSAGRFMYPTSVQKWHQTKDEAAWVGISGGGRSLGVISSLVQNFEKYEGAQHLATTIRDALIRDGFNLRGDREAPSADICLIIVDANGIHDCDQEFDALHITSNFWSRGAGSNFALGAGFALMKNGVDDGQTIVTTALEAACNYDSSCAEPLFIHFVPYPNNGED